LCKATVKSEVQQPSSIKVASSQTTLFFGKSLQTWSERADQSEALDGLCNEFTIKNLNSFPYRCQLVTYSQASSGVAEATGSRSAFKFTQAMYDSHLCQNREDTNLMTKLIVDLSGEQEMVVKLRFEPLAGAAPLHNGCLRISAVGHTEKFKLSLVGFMNRLVN
jgi:hypothetical protein